jgi:hypothetical protein
MSVRIGFSVGIWPFRIWIGKTFYKRKRRSRGAYQARRRQRP